jgi:hypothetical protein
MRGKIPLLGDGIFGFSKQMPKDWVKSNAKYWEWSKIGWSAPSLCSGKHDVLYVSTFFMGVAPHTDGAIITQDSFEMSLCQTHKFPYINGSRFKKWLDDDPEDALVRIGKWIWRCGAKIVVLKNDQLPLERAIILTCRKLGIPTVVVQHGLMNPLSERFLNVGDWADHRVVWGKYFARMMEANGLDARVWTYPRVITKAPPTQKSVCLLGPMPREDVRVVRRACRSLGVPLSYKLHPSAEKVTRKKHGARVIPNNPTIWNSIGANSIFFSQMSTGLVEAGLAGRTAIQIRRDGVPDLSEAGACHSVEPKYSTICDMILHTEPFIVYEDYIRSTNTFIEDWKQILEEVK